MSEMATIPLPATTRQLDAVSKTASSYNLAIGYLRAFVTVLVLAHQAVLADHPFAPPVATSLVLSPAGGKPFPSSIASAGAGSHCLSDSGSS